MDVVVVVGAHDLVGHEPADRLEARVPGGVEADLPVRIGPDPLVVDLCPDGRHDQQGHEQGDRSDHLARRQLLRAEGLPQQAEHDHDADERGGHQQDRWCQADDGHHQHDLNGRAEALGAGPLFGAAEQPGGQRQGAGAVGQFLGGGRHDVAEQDRRPQRHAATGMRVRRRCASAGLALRHGTVPPPAWSAARCVCLTEGLRPTKLGGAGSREKRCNTCRNEVVELRGMSCLQSPARRSTSSGSVISVSVSAPAVDRQTNSSFLPRRIRWASCRVASGARPRTSRTSSGSIRLAAGNFRLASHATAGTARRRWPGR